MALYSEAVAALEAREGITLIIRRTKDMDIAGVAFTESWEQTQIRCADILRVNTTVRQGTEMLHADEFWRRDKAYLVMGSQGFCQEMLKEDFLARHVPVGMLRTENYGSITAETGSDGTVLTFREASAGETWLVPESVQLHSAEGTATLSPEGELTASSYTLTYGYGGVTITEVCSFTVGQVNTEPKLPEDAKRFPAVESIDAPRLMMHGWGLLRCSTRALISSTDISYVNADAMVTNRSVAIHNDTGKTYTQYVSTDGSSTKIEPIVYEQTVLDGVYTFSGDGMETTTETLRPQDAALTVRDFLELGFPNVSSVGSASCTDLDGYMLLEFTLSNAAAQALLDEAAGMDTSHLLMKAAHGDFYVVVDQYTGLPTAWSRTFQGYLTQNQETFVTGSQIVASIDLASLSAPAIITGEDPAPLDTPVAPPFYRVSDSKGNYVWLLCEAPACDSRIQNMPQEIFDALGESKALTVVTAPGETEEAPDTAQMEQLMNQALLYTDGTTTRDHIMDSQLYNKAKAMMKAAGMHSDMMEYAKPTLWLTSLDAFFLRQGYSLNAQDSVAKILWEDAQARKIPLRQLAPADEMMALLAQMPDQLQEYALSQTLQDSTMTYLLDAEALYALWCAGDTAGLREHYATDPTLTQEELALRDAYQQTLRQQIQDDCLSQMLNALNEGQTLFFIMGPRYLYQEQGLLDALEDAGCTIELVSFG